MVLLSVGVEGHWLMLSGGVPLLHQRQMIGAVGVAGGGSSENNDLLGHTAVLTPASISAP